jgi:hypothetical protein
MDTPIIEVTIAAPVDTVWQALRDKDQLRRWHGWDYEEGGGLDQELDTIYFTDETEDAAAHRLELGGGDTFTLDETAGGTRLRIVRGAKTGGEWDEYYDDITQGWISFAQQLKFALERHPGEDRRTLFFSGTGQEPLPALGLTGVAETEVGKRYEAELAGKPIGGEVWFRTEYQLGLTVEGWGEGLLVLAYNPAKSAAMAILTTYGLSDADLDTLRDGWSPSWSNNYQL